MAKHEFSELEAQYQGFQHPSALIKINDVELSDKKKGYPISDIRVDLTCGFEASIAEFSIYDVYSEEAGCFEFGNKKVTEHLEDINGFLRKKKMENLKEIERTRK